MSVRLDAVAGSWALDGLVWADGLTGPSSFANLFKVAQVLVWAGGLAAFVWAVIVLTTRVRPGARWVRVALVVALALLSVRCGLQVAASLEEGSPYWTDFKIFHAVGRDVLAGVDPYGDDVFHSHPFLHPPTSFPFFAVLALLPYVPAVWVWALINLVLAACLVPLARHVLTGVSGGRWNLDEPTVGILSIALLLSNTVGPGIVDGQLAIFAATLLMLAIWAQTNGRPFLAGALLALATIKIGTLLPFLLLFCRRSDWGTVVACGLGVIVLLVVPGHPERLLGQFSQELKFIGALAAEGQVNDYSIRGTQFEGILGFDSWLYWLGLRDRDLIWKGEKGLVFLVTIWLTSRVWLCRWLPRTTAVALVGTFSVICLYHRNYDLVILALPLTYLAGEIRAEGPGRGWFTLASVALLISLFQYGRLARGLVELTEGWGAGGHLLRLLLVPAATWCVLTALVALYLGAKARYRHS